MNIKNLRKNIEETKTCFLENRPANKTLCGGRDMFKKVKINNGLKVTKNENKEESKLKYGNVQEKKYPEFKFGPSITPIKFK